jgi:hypothetical protein
MCSLNWFDIYRHYAGDDPIAEQILPAMRMRDAFLRTTPGMAMQALPNLVPVAPIAALGENRRDELNQRLRLSRAEKLVLVSMGGIASRLPIERWPRIDGVRWLVQDSWQVRHPDAVVLESLTMSFGDLLASCDALLCKPGLWQFCRGGLQRHIRVVRQSPRLAGIPRLGGMAATIWRMRRGPAYATGAWAYRRKFALTLVCPARLAAISGRSRTGGRLADAQAISLT